MPDIVAATAHGDSTLAASRASVVRRSTTGSLERSEAPCALPATQIGGVALEFDVEHCPIGRSARIHVRVRNDSAAPVSLERVALVCELPCDAAASLDFLRHGWQSWSLNGFEPVASEGDAVFPSGAWLRGMHHAVGERAPDRAGWHESHTLSVATTGRGALLAGVLETGRQFGLVNVRRLSAGGQARIEIELEWVVETVLEPGDALALEDAWFALGDEPNRLLEDFTTAWGRAGGARVGAPFQAGWCSWYHFFHGITEEALLRNLDALASRRDALPVDLFQLDDGYQHAIGDWLETNGKFPSGLAEVARRITDAGYQAGIWTAPFSAVGESHLLRDHPEWALRGDDGEWLRGTLIPEWSPAGWCYALDPSHTGFIAHLEHVHRTLAEMGFTYQKLDFLYMASMRGQAADRKVSRAERLARGLDAIRRGAGDDAFLLGCGCPLGPAVGRVDGMRIGPDVAPTWDVSAPNVIPGIEPALPSTGAAIRSITTRLFEHRRLWLNDPDCLMVRRQDTELMPDEIVSLADAIGASGGMVVFSDDIDGVDDDAAALLRSTVETARRVDAAAPWGVARVASAPASDTTRLVAEIGTRRLLTELNPTAMAVGEAPETLAPHASRSYFDSPARPVAVFCDFDGTFIRQDVGSGLARQHLGERREALRVRYDAGELDAWQYVELLFDGFDLEERVRLEYLDGIELDPGAPGLLDLCTERGWRFEVLSDGFDLNIEYLRGRFGLEFDFRSNHLEVGDAGWQIAPGARPVACACGTGVCKRGVIEALRHESPETLVVHVGNGRVSDFCAALAADWAFSKDTLTGALEQAGRTHLTFEDLGEVSAALERWLPVDAPPD